jgi:hypothetical protein
MALCACPVVTQWLSRLAPGSGSGPGEKGRVEPEADRLPYLRSDRRPGPTSWPRGTRYRIAWLRVMRGHRYADGAATTAVP